MMTFKEAKEAMSTAKNPDEGKPLGNNTRLYNRGKYFAVRLHSTDVVEIHPKGVYRIFSGGWRTPTTKDRINLYSPARLYQEKSLWYVDDFEFTDGMRVDSNGTPIGKYNLKGASDKKINKTKAMVKNYVKGFCDQISSDEGLPDPSAGDCFYCSMAIDQGNDVGHLISHMKENYFVPSLLVRALKERGVNVGFVWHEVRSHNAGFQVKQALTRYFQKRLLLISKEIDG